MEHRLEEISSCYRRLPSAIYEIFSKVLISLQFIFEIIAKYEKRGKYLPIFQEVTCDNYFIVICLLNSNVGIIILITNGIELA